MKHHFRGFTFLTFLQSVGLWKCTEQPLLWKKTPKKQKLNKKQRVRDSKTAIEIERIRI